MLETALSQLGSNFSSRFILGQFLPVFTMASINLLLFALYQSGWTASLDYVTGTLKIADFATIVAIVASASCAVAFTLGPLLNALRRILEGALLPDGMRLPLIDANRAWAAQQSAEIGALHDLVVLLDKARLAFDRPLVATEAPPPVEPRPMEWFERLCQAVAERLKPQGASNMAGADAQAAGNEVATPPPGPDILVDAAAAAVEAMALVLSDVETAAARGRSRDAIGTATQDVVIAARTALMTAAEALTNGPSDMFEAAQGRFIATVRRTLAIVMRLESDRRTALGQNYVPADPRPTRFGNLRASLEDYPFAVYGVGFDYLWPRIQLVLDKDDATPGSLTDAQTQLDYALIAMLLVMLTCAFWLVTLAWSDDQVPPFLIVGLASWLLFHLFYRIAIETQRSLSEVVKAVIDRYRFDLLDALCVARPTDNDGERAQWRRLADVASGGRPRPPIGYEPPSS